MKQLTALTTAGALILALLIITSPVLAQIGNGYDLSWFTIDNGGGTSSDANFSVIGTIGQPEAGTTLTAGDYTLTGGFWLGEKPGDESLGQPIYLPIIFRQ